MDDLEDDVVVPLKNGFLPGNAIPQIDGDGKVYKARVKNSSAKIGKSNGFRLIYYLVEKEEVYFLTIYSKKDKENLSNSFIEKIIRSFIR